MKNLKKSVAIFMTATMFFSSCVLATGCKKKPSGKVVKIEEDSPWYNAEVYDVSMATDGTDIDYVYYDFIGCVEDKALVRTEGSHSYPDDAWEDEDFDWNDYQFNLLQIFSMEGELVDTIDIQQLVKEEVSSSRGTGYYINNATLAGPNVIVNYVIYTETARSFDETSCAATLDIETGEFVNIEEADNGSDDNDLSCEGTMTAGDGYSIVKYWISGGERYSYILDVIDSDGNKTRLDLRDEFPDLSIFDISTIITIDETTCIIKPSMDGEDNREVVFKLDLANAEIEIDDTDYSWIPDNLSYNMEYIPEIGNVSLDGTGINVIDFSTNEVNQIFSFDMCNVNRNICENLRLCTYSDDQIVLAGTYYSNEIGTDYSTDHPVLMVLSKAEANPNVGKTMLTAAVMDYLDFYTAQAVVDFNNTNTEYFVAISDKYSVNDFYNDIDYDEDTDWEQLSLDAQSTISNQLAIDLIAGDGPDIIINAMEFRQLNNSDYLLDLSDYLENTDAYFSNVIDASMTDGKLYQMPLCFSVQGIRTDASKVENGQIGFTFDQYNEFVDEVCNGDNPIMLGQLDFFTSVIIGMNDVFEDGGSVNYDCDAFREFAEYVKDNVNEEFDFGDEYWGEAYYEGGDTTVETAEYTTVSSFSSFIGWDYSSTAVLLGIPSYDARGPMIRCGYSAAISAETASPDGCWAFISTLIDTPCQEGFASYGCPINVEAFENIAEIALEAHNASVRESLQWYTQEEIIQYGISELDSSVIDTYRNTMMSASVLASMDAAVQTILREEMPAYFSGQKSIDEVIDIIQDKVQTYINERG